MIKKPPSSQATGYRLQATGYRLQATAGCTPSSLLFKISPFFPRISQPSTFAPLPKEFTFTFGVNIYPFSKGK
jgi:hypothetical protein